jgi:hypothetical protein
MKKVVFFLGISLILSLKLNAQRYYSYQGPDVLKNTFLFSDRSFLINANQLEQRDVDSLLGISLKNSAELEVKAVPFTIVNQYNSRLPIGINQGSAIPNVGGQQIYSFGINLEYNNKLTIHIAPEHQFAQNLAFPRFPLNSTDWEQYYYYLNHIDIPERFGEQQLNSWNPGQSFIQYKYKNLVAKLSTENKWWGPASFNPLILGSNAPGFLHGSISTKEPIQTPLGKVEGEFIGGLLNNSGYGPPEQNRISTSTNTWLYKPKKESDRYLIGLVYSLQPKWVPGMYVGFAKIRMTYQNEFFSEASASMGSWFLRYAMPKEHAEIYFEYGRSDTDLSIANIFQSSPYGRGYTAGLKKGYSLGTSDQLILLGAEITNLSLPEKEQVDYQPKSWYLDDYIRQGFTNKGRVLGAGIGPGSNAQTVYVQWMKKLSFIGIRFNRVIHNLDYYHSTKYYRTDHFNQYWASLNTALYVNWHYKQLSLSGEVSWQRDYNYNWEWTRYTWIGFENIGADEVNYGGKLLIQYRF